MTSIIFIAVNRSPVSCKKKLRQHWELNSQPKGCNSPFLLTDLPWTQYGQYITWVTVLRECSIGDLSD